MEQLIGQSLDRYQLIDLLHKGTVAATFKANDIKFQHEVAINVVYPKLMQVDGKQEQFLEIARTNAQLKHPGLLQVSDFGRAHSWRYIVTDLVLGPTLAQMLGDMQAAGKWIPLPEALQLVRQICLAIEYTHKQGILHREVSPENIILKPEVLEVKLGEDLPYRPILTDLGLSALDTGESGSNQKLSDVALAYLSPEAILGQTLDARSDVYALGVLLYQLVFAKLPQIKTWEQAIDYHTQAQPASLTDLRADLPQFLEAIILKALAKNPDNRFPSAKAMAEALKEGLAQIFRPAIAPHSPEVTASAPTPIVNQINLSLARTHYSVTPGNTAQLSLTLHNEGPDDTIIVSVEGVPPDWVLPLSPQRLSADKEQEIKITINPPRVVQTRPGRYPLVIRALSKNTPDKSEQLHGLLTVSSYSEFSAEIQKGTIVGNQQISHVVIRNQGNSPEAFTVNWRDSAKKLKFEPPQTRLTVPEGQAIKVEFEVTPIQQPLIGSKQKYPFSAQVESMAGETKTQQGESVIAPLIPTWAFILVTIPLLLVCCIAGGFYINSLIPAEVAPVVQSVVVNPPNPVAGDPVAIEWEIDDAREMEILPDIGSVDPAEGRYIFQQGFTQTTNLTIIVSNRVGSVEHPLTIRVIPATPTATPEPTEPIVDEWFVFPTEITEGNAVVIRWQVSNAESVILEPFGPVDKAGQIQDTPTQSTTYTLIATNGDKQIEESQTVSVIPALPNAPKVNLFTVEPGILVRGDADTVRLTWETERADTISMEPNIGAISLSGFADIPAPSESTIYTLSAQNAGGEIKAQVQVRVVTPTATLEPTPTPTPSATPTATPSATLSPTPSATLAPTATPTATPPPTATPQAATPTPTSTPLAPTFTPTQAATVASTPTFTPTITPPVVETIVVTGTLTLPTTSP